MNSVLIIDDDKRTLCLDEKNGNGTRNLSAVVAHGGLGSEATGKKQGYLFTNYSGCDDADMNGFQKYCRKSAEKKTMQSADADRQKRRKEDKVSGLRLGADVII